MASTPQPEAPTSEMPAPTADSENQIRPNENSSPHQPKSPAGDKQVLPSSDKEKEKQMKKPDENEPKGLLPPIDLMELNTLLRDPNMPSKKILLEVAEKVIPSGDGKQREGCNEITGMKGLFDCILEVSLKQAESDNSDEDEDDEPLNLKFPCEFCNKVFCNSMEMKTHILVLHSKQDPSVLNQRRIAGHAQKISPSHRRSRDSLKSDSDGKEHRATHHPRTGGGVGKGRNENVPRSQGQQHTVMTPPQNFPKGVGRTESDVVGSKPGSHPVSAQQVPKPNVGIDSTAPSQPLGTASTQPSSGPNLGSGEGAKSEEKTLQSSNPSLVTRETKPTSTSESTSSLGGEGASDLSEDKAKTATAKDGSERKRSSEGDSEDSSAGKRVRRSRSRDQSAQESNTKSASTPRRSSRRH